MGVLSGLCSFLVRDDPPQRADIIFVHAGRPERKPFGLELFRSGLASRLVLSVGRFELQEIARLGLKVQPDLQELAARRSPAERHFLVDLTEAGCRGVARGDAGKGTYEELCSLALYLGPAGIRRMLLVSTSVHLHRIEWCCRRIAFFKAKELRFVPVPEALSSFRRAGWWRHQDHWFYVISEYGKLGIYSAGFDSHFRRRQSC